MVEKTQRNILCEKKSHENSKEKLVDCVTEMARLHCCIGFLYKVGHKLTVSKSSISLARINLSLIKREIFLHETWHTFNFHHVGYKTFASDLAVGFFSR